MHSLTTSFLQEQAFELSQKYKEGKFIIELSHMIKDNGWDWEAAPSSFLRDFSPPQPFSKRRTSTPPPHRFKGFCVASSSCVRRHRRATLSLCTASPRLACDALSLCVLPVLTSGRRPHLLIFLEIISITNCAGEHGWCEWVSERVICVRVGVRD